VLASGRSTMPMPGSDDVDDELARRFRQVFSKEPVSQAKHEEKWRAAGAEEYDVDDEDVSSFLSRGN
jgi:hypothetical protein